MWKIIWNQISNVFFHYKWMAFHFKSFAFQCRFRFVCKTFCFCSEIRWVSRETKLWFFTFFEHSTFVLMILKWNSLVKMESAREAWRVESLFCERTYFNFFSLSPFQEDFLLKCLWKRATCNLYRTGIWVRRQIDGSYLVLLYYRCDSLELRYDQWPTTNFYCWTLFHWREFMFNIYIVDIFLL